MHRTTEENGKTPGTIYIIISCMIVLITLIGKNVSMHVLSFLNVKDA